MKLTHIQNRTIVIVILCSACTAHAQFPYNEPVKSNWHLGGQLNYLQLRNDVYDNYKHSTKPGKWKQYTHDLYCVQVSLSRQKKWFDFGMNLGWCEIIKNDKTLEGYAKDPVSTYHGIWFSTYFLANPWYRSPISPVAGIIGEWGLIPTPVVGLRGKVGDWSATFSGRYLPYIWMDNKERHGMVAFTLNVRRRLN